MVSELTLIITDSGDEVARVKYAVKSVFPACGTAVLELTDFLERAEECKGDIRFPEGAATINRIISRCGRSDCLSEDTREKLEKLDRIYIALAYENKRRCREKIIQLKKCDAMLAASYKVAQLIKNSNFESLTAGDFLAMKRCIMTFIPKISELMDFPSDYMEKIRPVFDLLKMIIDIVPSDEDKRYIDNIFDLFY